MEYIEKLESYIAEVPNNPVPDFEVDYKILDGKASVWLSSDKERIYKEIAYLDEKMFYMWATSESARRHVMNKVYRYSPMTHESSRGYLE